MAVFDVWSLRALPQALYVLDPVTGNTLGFKPNDLLTPHDAFLLFDADRWVCPSY